MLTLTMKYGEIVRLHTKEGVVTIRLGVAGQDRTKIFIDAPHAIGIQRDKYVQKEMKRE